MSGPPTDPPPPEAAAPHDPYRCPRCSSPYDPFQEYCLECGQRLVPYPAGSIWRRDAWSRQSPLWFWGALTALFAIALVTGAIVLAARDDDGKKSAQGPTTSVLSSPTFSTDLGTTDTLASTAQGPTTIDTSTLGTSIPSTSNTTPTFPSSTVPTTPPPTPPPPPTTNGGLTTWPAGKSGYTVILESLPEARGRPAAESRAQQAKADGLPEVGVLNSGNYSTLNAGYWVVFSGVYDTQSEANSALPAAKSAGWSAAYVRQIAP